MQDTDKCKKQLEDLINSNLSTGERLEKFMAMVDTDKLYEELSMKAKIAEDTGLPIISTVDNFTATIIEVYKPEWFKKSKKTRIDVPEHIGEMRDNLIKAVKDSVEELHDSELSPEKQVVVDLFAKHAKNSSTKKPRVH